MAGRQSSIAPRTMLGSNTTSLRSSSGSAHPDDRKRVRDWLVHRLSIKPCVYAATSTGWRGKRPVLRQPVRTATFSRSMIGTLVWWRESLLTQARDIPQRRAAEEAAVLATEL